MCHTKKLKLAKDKYAPSLLVAKSSEVFILYMGQGPFQVKCNHINPKGSNEIIGGGGEAAGGREQGHEAKLNFMLDSCDFSKKKN